ncbi:T9SS type A sorting domain-containing protein [Flavobacterium sp. RHBU_3]|uniref:T9SS type A sorting domain-containing protein n=1 Tax=Flavobacterium sp. RHBU_3 TaxID=3391184 RepID=UPI00398510FB
MKKILLTFIFMLVTLLSYAQDVTAYPVPNINQCGYEVFDLTQQNAIALGNQDPVIFSVTYFTSEASAAAGAPAITNPTSYVSQGPDQTIYLRVTNTDTGDFDVTSFHIIVGSGQSVGFFNDVTVCGSYTPPPLTVGAYYTGPGGTGTQILTGDIITTTTLVYVYYNNGTCTSEESFVVTVVTEDNLPQVEDVVSCGIYTFPVPPAGYGYFTGPGGTGQLFMAGTALTTSATIYLFDPNMPCSENLSYTVTINGSGSSIVPPSPLVGCDTDNTGFATFNLLQLQSDFEMANPTYSVQGFYTTQADALAGVNAIPSAEAFVNYVPGQQTIYIAVSFEGCLAPVPVELITLPCAGTTALTGTVTLDANSDGCDAADSPAAGVLVLCNFGNYVFNAYTDINGQYTFSSVPEGIVTLWIQNINGQALTPNPTSVTLNLPGDAMVNNFCLSVPAPYTDVAVYISPYSAAVPGFTAYYAVSVVNYGTVPASGTLSFSYDNTLLSLANAGGGVATGNILTWDYTNLAPYQSIIKYVQLNVLTPPTVISGTQLIFSASATAENTDVNPDNNAYLYTQYAVNSFDPNDIAVREGEFITEAQADGFLNYTIRFQNTGTANAQNVHVNLPLDANLDWNTFQPVAGSHTFETSRTEGSVDFMFNNIQLPYESANEPGSHGFVSFRIKPVANAQVGDSMSETAYIYFDFNEAIVTNTVTTTITSAAAVANNKDKVFTLYPNPASDVVNINLNEQANATVKVTDVLGKTVIKPTNTSGTLDVRNLVNGVYFVTVTVNNESSVQKLIIRK